MVLTCCKHFGWEAALKTKAGRVPSAAVISSIPSRPLVRGQTQLQTWASASQARPQLCWQVEWLGRGMGETLGKAEKGLNVLKIVLGLVFVLVTAGETHHPQQHLVQRYLAEVAWIAGVGCSGEMLLQGWG